GGGWRVEKTWRARRVSPPPVRENALSTLRPPPSTLVFQFLVAIYGGYFGAGVGILMLAALGFAGFTNIHQMNGLKNWGGLCMNAVAAITFAFTDIVSWPVALAMGVGATLGGYAGSRLAQRVSQTAVRRAILVIGLTSGVWLLVE
ncbi:MAG: sulfite exporter TauE/SafE family protein, partial [Gemmatimonadaceae bacterium]